MTDFTHVSIPTLRDVLEGRILAGTNILAGCLAVTSAALGEDALNEDVSLDTLYARQGALESAYAAHESGDNTATLEALRRCWSV
jgi:hypothetical protein